VPHFEKMLYDNAQLVRVYLQALQVTGDPEYRRVAVETLDYVIREMQGPEGGYYSATDADSEGIEGKFFVWNQDEIDAELGRPESEWFCLHHDVSPSGNWEGVNILNTPRSVEDDASELGISADTLRASLGESKKKLYEARKRRVPPLTDDKVLASWNGLMIGAMAEGARVLGDRRYLESAERAGRFVLGALARPDGGLFRTARAGKAHLDGYLEDYAFVADGLADLYEAGGDEAFVREAERLAARMIEDFAEPGGGAFFQTARTHEALIARTREGHDGAIPNGNAVAARVLARFAAHFGRDDFKERAIGAIAAYGRSIERSARAFCTTLGVVDFLLEAPVELALIGDPESEAGKELARAVGAHYLPNRIVAHARDPEALSHPLLKGKALLQGGPALYVCKNFTCQAPVGSGADVARVLGDAVRSLSEGRARIVGDRRLSGAASVAATAAYAARFEGARGKAAFTLLGSTGLTVSRAGFGSYRVDDRVRTHRDALRAALTSGVNLIDTSTNYSDGHSERLIGEVLAELVSAGTVGRDEIVVVSKIGYAQGQNLELLAAREAGGDPIPEVVAVGEGLAHCIHPAWIEDQLGRALSRLGVSTLDVCLLHNPEYFLADAAKRGVPLEEARIEFYRRVTEAFRQLEREASAGRILHYGVSSNTAVDEAAGADATDAARFVDAAREAGGDAHHFRVLQVPMNLLEPGGALVPNAGPGSRETAAAVALRHGVAVLVNRPLNGIREDRLIRLADPPALPEAPNLGEQLTAVRRLEQEFASVFAPALRPAKNAQVQPKDLFKWADALGDAAMRIDSFETFRDIETRQVAPRILETMGALERAMTGPLGVKFAMWRERYLTEMEGLFASLRHRAADRSRLRSRSIGAAIDPFLPEVVKNSSLSRKAVRVLLDVPGVTSVLVGMRHADYVKDVLEALSLEGGARATEALAALRNAEIR
jgi:aryl-alcohol dehydrogenase-like predicted oxidoreductase